VTIFNSVLTRLCYAKSFGASRRERQQTPRWGVEKRQWRASRFCLPPASRPPPRAAPRQGAEPPDPQGRRCLPPVAAERLPRLPPPPAGQEREEVRSRSRIQFQIYLKGGRRGDPRSGGRGHSAGKVVHSRQAGRPVREAQPCGQPVPVPDPEFGSLEIIRGKTMVFLGEMGGGVCSR
jgi:hypothetical protein